MKYADIGVAGRMIDGVVLRELKPIPDERGWLLELMRSDWEEFERFGQVYLTTIYPGVVKAWHYHKRQTDNMVCIKGMLKLVLYDSRKTSHTHKQIEEVFFGDRKPLLVKIPPLVKHGFKAIGTETAYAINIPTDLYNYKQPDEFRLPPDTKQIPYDWGLAPGLKHG
jgi:dTDP-4-dehydrorhamnose 3,5-epimerase